MKFQYEDYVEFKLGHSITIPVLNPDCDLYFEQYTCIELGEWINDYKDYETRECVVQRKSDDKCFIFTMGRDDNRYGCDWDPESTELVKVERVKVLKHEWRVVK